MGKDGRFNECNAADNDIKSITSHLFRRLPHIGIWFLDDFESGLLGSSTIFLLR